MTLNRRHFLGLLSAGTGTIAASIYTPSFAWAAESPEKQATPAFTVPPLPYAYNALEPHIDERTMQFHHDKHHAAYVKGLNAVVEKYPQLRGKTAQALLLSLDSLPEDVRASVRNNGGGHVNHTMFWQIMGPNGGGEPTGFLPSPTRHQLDVWQLRCLQTAVQRCRNQTLRFWLGLARLHPEGTLQVTTTANQDNPLLDGLYPVLGNDVWEHAYYLKYQNRRPDYLCLVERRQLASD